MAGTNGSANLIVEGPESEEVEEGGESRARNIGGRSDVSESENESSLTDEDEHGEAQNGAGGVAPADDNQVRENIAGGWRIEDQALAQLPPEQWEGNNLEQLHMLASIFNNIRYQANTLLMLTAEEREHALAIKAAIQEDKGLEEVPDLRYAQLALIDGDDVQNAVDRIRHYQVLMEEYQFKDNFEEGKEIMQAYFRQQPKHVLSVAFNAIDGNYVFIYDMAAFDPRNITRSEEDFRIAVGFFYYLLQALTPDLHAIRQGCVWIAECEGYTWDLIDLGCTRRLQEEVFAKYPIVIHEINCFHSGVVANTLLAMVKRFQPKYLQNRINLGCQFEGRLDTYYAMPDWETASQKNLQEINSLIHRRYSSEHEFKL